MILPDFRKRLIEGAILVTFLYILFTAFGCVKAIQPIQPKPGVQEVMLIPAGTRIGDIVTDANGVYFNENFPGEIYVLPPGSTIELEPEIDYM